MSASILTESGRLSISPPRSRDLTTLRIAGVPEHFNYPWQLAIKGRLFEEAGLRVEFTSSPGGTGAMLQSVIAGDTDVAVALTEGIVAGIVNQEATSVQLRYCGEYVVSITSLASQY